MSGGVNEGGSWNDKQPTMTHPHSQLTPSQASILPPTPLYAFLLSLTSSRLISHSLFIYRLYHTPSLSSTISYCLTFYPIFLFSVLYHLTHLSYPIFYNTLIFSSRIFNFPFYYITSLHHPTL